MSQIIYRYDGSFAGFLCCVFDSYLNREIPMDFQSSDDLQPTLFPVRWVGTDEGHARRVLASIRRISPRAGDLVVKGFLTCAPQRELLLYRFVRALYDVGAPLLSRLSDEAVFPLLKAVRHLDGEVQLLRGFVRFSEFQGTLVGEIRPKNRVLPLLRPHFCARMREETFLLYDRTHREALFHRGGQWRILPLEDFRMAAPDQREAQFRRLWKRFYDTVAIEARYNPRTRMTHMPKRYWDTMTEFQEEASFSAVPGGSGALPGPAPDAAQS